MSELDKYKNNPLALQAWQEGYEEGMDQCESTADTFKLIVVITACILGVLLVSGCSDRYRYPCQDPANQTKQECTPPECEADGTCAKYLLKDSNET